MSIFSPPKPKVAKPPLQSEPITLGAANTDLGLNRPGSSTGSLISTSAQGLRRKPTTRKPSLIGGGTNASA